MGTPIWLPLELPRDRDRERGTTSARQQRDISAVPEGLGAHDAGADRRGRPGDLSRDAAPERRRELAAERALEELPGLDLAQGGRERLVEPES